MKKATLRNAKVAFLWIEGYEQLYSFWETPSHSLKNTLIDNTNHRHSNWHFIKPSKAFYLIQGKILG